MELRELIKLPNTLKLAECGVKNKDLKFRQLLCQKLLGVIKERGGLGFDGDSRTRSVESSPSFPPSLPSCLVLDTTTAVKLHQAHSYVGKWWWWWGFFPVLTVLWHLYHADV